MSIECCCQKQLIFVSFYFVSNNFCYTKTNIIKQNMDDLNLDNTMDDGFFRSLESNSSKLQQLFVDDVSFLDNKQQSLKYQRPKDVSTASNATSTTLMAKVVTAYRESVFQGKVGLALTKNPDNTCNLIMYKTKALILASLKLQPGKDLLYKQTEYWQFYDEVPTYWSISFESQLDEEEFVENLRINSITFKEKQEILDQRAEKREAESTAVEDIGGKISADDTKDPKISLIKRMAKMGKPLPTAWSSSHQTTTELSDSSDTEVIKTPLALTQKPYIVPRSNKISSNKATQQLVPSAVVFNSVANTSSGAVYPVNALESQYMQMLLTEQRTQGTELRMNMNKLENKIEKVLDKLELYDGNDGKQRVEKEDEILELEEKLIKLKKENRKLKQSLQESILKESEENEVKILLYDFKEDLRLCNINFKQDSKNVLIETINKLKECHIEKQEMQKKIIENELQLKELRTELDLKTTKNDELQNQVSSLQQKNNDLTLQLNEKATNILKQKEKILDLENKLQEKNSANVNNHNESLIKSIINNLYIDIADKLNNMNLPNSEKVLSLIASSIKQNTLQSLQQNNLKDYC